ncbi:deaminase [Providencia sp. PROV089]|uniref:deaminase n=1 Tax=Providencia sp. PROV089 TaxID=2949805 RepID=UPI002349708F|nr:deaminase [Providencia sp. PROV089]
MKFKPETLMDIAFSIAKESKCVKYKIGCVIEKDGNIIATGCNGTPTGSRNCCQVANDKQWNMSNPTHRLEHREWSDINEIHAEMNAIMTAKEPIRNANVYVTVEPCNQCAKNLVQGGVKSVTYSLSKGTGGEFMKRHGVLVRHMPICYPIG